MRRVRVDEVDELRRVRLAMLLDTPDAFASRHADEAAQPDEFWQERAAIAAQSSQVATFHVVDGRPPRRQRHRPAPRPRPRGRPGRDVGRTGVAPARDRATAGGGRVPLGGAPGQRLDRAGRARAEHGCTRPLPPLRLRGDRRAASGRGRARPDGAADAPLAGRAAAGPGGEAPPPSGRAGRPARGAARLRPALAAAARHPAPRGGSRPGRRPAGAARRRHAGAGRGGRARAAAGGAAGDRRRARVRAGDALAGGPGRRQHGAGRARSEPVPCNRPQRRGAGRPHHQPGPGGGPAAARRRGLGAALLGGTGAAHAAVRRRLEPALRPVRAGQRRAHGSPITASGWPPCTSTSPPTCA